MTACWVAASRPEYSLHVMVSESAGAGAPGVDGAGEDGRASELDGGLVLGVVLRVVVGPGSVVEATVPVVV